MNVLILLLKCVGSAAEKMMRFYVENHIPAEVRQLFETIQRIITELPDVDLGVDEQVSRCCSRATSWRGRLRGIFRS